MTLLIAQRRKMNKLAFPYPGGKFKVVDWLLEYFPRDGDIYLEPFAGRGNVFFNVRGELNFRRFILNDPITYKFFIALREIDSSSLPTEPDFEWLKLMVLADDPVALVLEPVLSFRGKGYKHGGLKDHDPDRYNVTAYRAKIVEAKALLYNVTILGKSWEHIKWSQLTEDSFVYLDPPYLDTSGVGYENIDHVALCCLLKTAPFRWIISGYDTPSYRWLLGDPLDTLERYRDMSNTGEKVVECIWSNI